jgi:hypothetical protein
MLRIFYFLFIIILLTGCIHELSTKKEHPECQTTISGCFHYSIKSNNKDTVMLLKGFFNDVPIRGKIIDKTSEGFIFDPAKKLKRDAPPTLYKFDEIRYVLGSNGKLIYGKFPDSVNLVPTISIIFHKEIDTFPEPESIKMSFKADEPFTFCIDRGRFRVTSISMSILSQSLIGEPEISFDVAEGFDNYLGDIYIDSLAEGDGVHLLRFYIMKSKGGRRIQKDKIYIPQGYSFRDWLDDKHIGYHSFVVKDEMKDSAGRKKALIMINK